MHDDMLVVGIGDSAGGLEALLPFVAYLSPENNMSYIIIQHSSVNTGSTLAELLRSKTKLDVQEATDGVQLCPDTIYVAPTDRDMDIKNGCIKLMQRPASQLKNSINRFFNILASTYQDKAIGIIFSGSGHDGANGIKAIKNAGGITIAQQPETAKFDSMPKAAIEIGNADYILSPVEAACKLAAIANHLNRLVTDEIESETSLSISHIVDKILTVTGMDFVNYKYCTIVRQVERRMAALHIDDLETYDQFTGDNPGELTKLANSFLVPVTSFFRDEQCFNALRQALKEVIKRKKVGDDIRIWVPGCATGEEVYSIAIILAEELGAELTRYRVQIYGTDINAEGIQTARKGEYGLVSLNGLDTVLKTKYFFEKEHGFAVVKKLRDLVVFSRHDLIRNPPFIHLDLISCRNLLIYFNQDLQEQVLKVFHYALVSNGILFLGLAESLWSLNDLFSEFERNSKLFIKNDIPVIRPDLNGKMLANFQLNRHEKGETRIKQTFEMLGQEKLVDIFAPPSILVTREGKILEFYKNCDDFIKIKTGKADFNIFSIIDPTLKMELKAFCHHAILSNKTVTSPSFTFVAGNKASNYRMLVAPVYYQPSKQELLLISFEEIAHYSDMTEADHGSLLRLTGMEHELKAARETLHTVTEALEASIVEWQALNEEAQSANEELQSTNEELETANEELQSINEELTLVNDELTLKTKELGEVNDDLHNVFDGIEKAVVVVDSRLHINRYNEASKRFFNIGFADDDQLNLNALEPVLSFEKLISNITQVISTGQSFHDKFVMQKQHFQLNIYPYRKGNADTITGAVLTIQDITVQYRAEQQIRLSASVFDAANEAIVITDSNNKIISINPAFTRITGYEKEEVIGKNPSLLSSGRQQPKFYHCMWKSMEETGKWQGEIWNKRKDGEIYPEWLSISALRDEAGKVIRYIGIFTDISVSLKDRRTIIQQAHFDSLTKLPNRKLFFDRLQQAIANAKRTRKFVGVMFIDLDGFKDINDTLGHSQGDILLQQIAKRMVKVFRESDTIARFGGDEFTVLVPDMESETDAIPTAEKILEAIQAPIAVKHHELIITASIGVALYPNDGEDVETLLKHADSAMYTAKAEGRNAYRFFTAAMYEKAQKQHRIANDIKNAVKQNQFTVFYQPVYDLRCNRVVGAEALIRWRHPTSGYISPEEFIPIAESLNVISKIGEFVLDKACRFMAGLNASLDQPLSIAVNFSSLQFVPGNCAENWLRIIKDSGIGLNNVIVEITESLMMSHQDNYIQQLDMLRPHGIKIAMDDFGTGFSSLSYLKKLPLDILKIDKSFIRDVLVDQSDAALVETIIAIAKNFSLELIAEGVEEKGQADFLIALDCRYAQGYYYSKAIPEEHFKQLALNKSLSF